MKTHVRITLGSTRRTYAVECACGHTTRRVTALDKAEAMYQRHRKRCAA